MANFGVSSWKKHNAEEESIIEELKKYEHRLKFKSNEINAQRKFD